MGVQTRANNIFVFIEPEYSQVSVPNLQRRFIVYENSNDRENVAVDESETIKVLDEKVKLGAQ